MSDFFHRMSTMVTEPSFQVKVGENVCWVDVISKEFEPSLPYFVGAISTKQHLYFISSEVPHRFRKAVITHEDLCFGMKEGGMPHGYCACAVAGELAIVADADRSEYLAMRIMFFDALIVRSASGRSEFLAEITGARDRLRVFAGG